MTSLSRRSFMLGSASTVGLVSMGIGLKANASQAPSLVLVSDSLAADLDLMPAVSGKQNLVILGSDPVAQSREKIADCLAARIPISGITDWSDYVVMRGIAKDYSYRHFSDAEAVVLSGIDTGINPAGQPASNFLDNRKRYFRWHFS